MKICLVGAEFFNADWRIDMNLIVDFRKFCEHVLKMNHLFYNKRKGKAVPLHAWSGA